jgi:Flp pilus assembly CpaE family ATPase
VRNELAKGGCGLSTVAAHSAAALRRDPKCSVLLADLNLKAASAAFLMHVNPRHTLDSALSSIHRMDATLWSAIVTTTEQGVALAPPPAEHVHASRADSKRVARADAVLEDSV